MATKAEQIWQKARVMLVLKQPFFGILALKLKFIPDPSGGGQGTCGVDIEKNLVYNPEFVESLDPWDAGAVLMHEIGHLVQSCHARFPEGGNHMLWNLAADMAVNTWVVETDIGSKSKIMNDIFPLDMRAYAAGKSTEQMYIDMLKEEFEPQACKCDFLSDQGEGNSGGQGGGQGDDGDQESQQGGGGGGDKDTPDRHPANGLGCSSASHIKKPQPKQIRAIKQDIQAAATAVANRASGRGDLPGFVQDFLAKISKPTVTWKDHLRRAAVESFRGNYTFNRPGRRSAAIGMRLPSRKPSPQGAIVVIDTSGSISDKMISQFISETVGIMNAAKCPWVDIYFHDTECYFHDRFTPKTLTKIKVQRGGTSHIHVFEKIEASKKNIGMVICFTDLMTCFPDKPKYPVIWAVPKEYYGRCHAPWGKELEVKI